jgi:Tol biopolymer transport system component
MTTRLLWSGSVGATNVPVSISFDGATVAYISRGDVFAHDMASGADRNLTHKPKEAVNTSARQPVVSRDGRQVAYVWVTRPSVGTVPHWQVQLVDVAGDAAPTHLYDNSEVDSIDLFDWSPDGKSIAVEIRRPDRTAQIGLLSVPEGSLRVLRSIDWRASNNVAFSPDGRYLAYDLPQSDATQARDVFVLAADASEETTVVRHASDDELVGWSPDGTSILFTSDRSGTIDLWSVRFAKAKSEGEPERLKSNIGMLVPVGITRSGSLYYRSQSGGRRDIQLARLDATTGTYTAAPLDPIYDGLRATDFAIWSPDGRELAYLAEHGRGAGRQLSLEIRSVESEKSRAFHLALSYFFPVAWLSSPGAVVVRGADFKGRTGLFRVNPDNGEMSAIALDQPGQILPYAPVFAPDGRFFIGLITGAKGGVYRVDTASGETAQILPVAPEQSGFGLYVALSPDGKRVYVRRVLKTGPSTTEDCDILEHDLTTGLERVLARRSFLGPPKPTPDGKYILTDTTDAIRNVRILLLIPTNGGEPREVLQVPSEVKPEAVNDFEVGRWPFPSITDGGRALLVRERLNDQTNESAIWFVPVDGTGPRKVGHIPAGFETGSFAVGPDPRHFAYTMSDARPGTLEFWALENFLPKAHGSSK